MAELQRPPPAYCAQPEGATAEDLPTYSSQSTLYPNFRHEDRKQPTIAPTDIEASAGSQRRSMAGSGIAHGVSRSIQRLPGYRSLSRFWRGFRFFLHTVRRNPRGFLCLISPLIIIGLVLAVGAMVYLLDVKSSKQVVQYGGPGTAGVQQDCRLDEYDDDDVWCGANNTLMGWAKKNGTRPVW